MLKMSKSSCCCSCSCCCSRCDCSKTLLKNENLFQSKMIEIDEDPIQNETNNFAQTNSIDLLQHVPKVNKLYVLYYTNEKIKIYYLLC